MKHPLVVRLKAEARIAEAGNFYKVHSESTLQNFIEVLDELFDKILDSSRLYAVRFKTIRRINLAKFPYALWFEIVAGIDPVTGEEMEFVVVPRCYHQHRNITPHSFE